MVQETRKSKTKKSKKHSQTAQHNNDGKNSLSRIITKIEFQLQSNKFFRFFHKYHNSILSIIFTVVIYKYFQFKTRYSGHLAGRDKRHTYHLGDASAFEAALTAEEIDLPMLREELFQNVTNGSDHNVAVNQNSSDSNANWMHGQEELLYHMKHPVPTKSPEEIIAEEEKVGIRHPNRYGSPANINFVFHNKLPKAGSSTMNILLDTLAQQNRFHFIKIMPNALPGDKFNTEQPLIAFLEDYKMSRTDLEGMTLVLLKHHYPFNFTKYNRVQPTFINVMRDPTSWFQSHYYFERYGWQRKQEKRTTGQKKSLTEEDMKMTVNECIDKRNKACTDPSWKYTEFFCGTDESCKSRSTKTKMFSDLHLQNAMETAKRNMVNFFYTYGILEQWDDTLALLEAMLPSVYKDVQKIWRTQRVQAIRNSTKSIKHEKLTPENKEWLINGPLKWDYELYSFGRKVFNDRLREFGLVRDFDSEEAKLARLIQVFNATEAQLRESGKLRDKTEISEDMKARIDAAREIKKGPRQLTRFELKQQEEAKKIEALKALGHISEDGEEEEEPVSFDSFVAGEGGTEGGMPPLPTLAAM